MKPRAWRGDGVELDPDTMQPMKPNQDKPQTGTYFGDSGMSYKRTGNQDSQDEHKPFTDEQLLELVDATLWGFTYWVARERDGGEPTENDKAYHAQQVEILMRNFKANHNAHTQRAVTEATKKELTEIYTAIDGETVSNEYVFNLQNAIEDRIAQLTKDTEGDKHE